MFDALEKHRRSKKKLNKQNKPSVENCNFETNNVDLEQKMHAQTVKRNKSQTLTSNRALNVEKNSPSHINSHIKIETSKFLWYDASKSIEKTKTIG